MDQGSAIACLGAARPFEAAQAALYATAKTDTCKLEVRWASCEEDVRQAQRLRYRVFAQEMGAHLTPPAGTPPNVDADHFDPFCDHLLVSVASSAGNPGDANAGNSINKEQSPDMLVGTYRVLPPWAARRAGGLYIDTEFDLAPLASLRAQAVELGRSCVHPDWRSGGVIIALWTALGQYMVEHGLDTMIGCASVSLGNLNEVGGGGQTAENLWCHLRHTHLVAPHWQVRPRCPLPLESMAGTLPNGDSGRVVTPPLIKGYLRCGAKLLGPPALDRAFNTADLPMMLRTSELVPRYRQHFLGV